MNAAVSHTEWKIMNIVLPPLKLGNQYTVIWSAALQYLIYLARESRHYASPYIGSPLPNKSDIGQAADQTTVLLFPPRMLI